MFTWSRPRRTVRLSIGLLRHTAMMRSSPFSAKFTLIWTLVLTERRLTRKRRAELKMRHNSARKLEAAP